MGWLKIADQPDIEHVPPCRIIVQGGQPVENLVVTERPRRHDDYVRTSIPPTRTTIYLPHLCGSERKRATPKQAKPKGPKPAAWNKMRQVTSDRILELQSKGMDAQQIANALGCKRPTIYARLRRSRRTDAAMLAQDVQLRTCPCGAKKLPHHTKCADCKRGRKTLRPHPGKIPIDKASSKE